VVECLKDKDLLILPCNKEVVECLKDKDLLTLPCNEEVVECLKDKDLLILATFLFRPYQERLRNDTREKYYRPW